MERPHNWQSYRHYISLENLAFVYAWGTLLLIACNSNGTNVWMLNDTWSQNCVNQRRWCNLNRAVLLKNARVCLMYCGVVHIIKHLSWLQVRKREELGRRLQCLTAAPSKAPYTPGLSSINQLFWNILALCGLPMTAAETGSHSSELRLSPLLHPSLCTLLIFPPQKNSPLQSHFGLSLSLSLFTGV